MAKKTAKPPALPKQFQPQTIFTKVRGVTFNNRQSLVRKCRPGQQLTLIREPDNEHDENAIAVCIPGGLLRKPKMLGHLSEDLADNLAEELDAGNTITAFVEDVTGGGGMLWWKKAYGLNIRLTYTPSP